LLVFVYKKSNFVVTKTSKLHEGRTTITEVTNDSEEQFAHLVLVNIYAPADGIKERVKYFENLDKDLEQYLLNITGNFDLMLTGDFNCVTEQNDKSKPFCLTREQSSQLLLSIMGKYGIFDVWRRYNGNKQQFTWRQLDGKNENRNTACRLDRWLIGNPMAGNVVKCNIIPSILSDHLPVILRLESTTNTKRGKGFWKFNNNLLKDKVFTNMVDTLWREHKTTIHSEYNGNHLKWWDAGKLKIRNLAIKRSQELKKDKDIVHKNLLGSLEELMQQYDRNPCCNLSEKITHLQKVIEQLENDKMEGVRIRSRVKWFEEGEKPSKYFLTMESSKGRSKTWTKIRKSDGTVSTKIEDILQTQIDFYSDLYTEEKTDPEAQKKLLENITTPLSEDSRSECEGIITEEEIDIALKSFDNNKSPGNDGLSKEFYKFFWSILKEDLLRVLNFAFQAGHMSDSQQEAIITLLYKSGDKEEVKNWRPISLLNVDYKILTKCIANRIKKVMNKIISRDQTCGIPGRSIYENIIFTQDAIFYANKNNKPLVIVSLDQSKAFDRVNRNFIFKCLSKFGFGEDLVKWAKTIYTDTKSKICTNGFLSESFTLTRGVRQGCPLSPLLYIIVAETLSLLIKKNKNIKGFILPDNTEAKIKAYADDTNTYLRDIISIKELFKSLEIYSKATESKLNKDKTKLLLCGSLRGKEDELEGRQNEEKLKVLGIWVGNEDTRDENWYPILMGVRKILNLWSMRDLSIFGRVQIVNTLALAKLWYVSSVCIAPTKIINEIQKEVWLFVWNKKRHAVSKKNCFKPKEEGGLGMIDIEEKCKCLRLKWLVQLMEGKENGDAFRLGCFFIENFDKSFKTFNVITTTLKNIKNDNVPLLYVDMIETWRNIGLERTPPTLSQPILEEFLWLNPLLKHHGETMYNPTWLQANILKVKDMWNPETKAWHTFEVILKRFPIFFQNNRRAVQDMYRKILFSISEKQWIDALKCDNGTNIVENKNFLYLWYGKKSKELKCKVLYNLIMDKKLNITTIQEIRVWWNLFHKSDFTKKVLDFLWLSFYDALPLGKKLKEWFTDESGLCVFCKIYEEDMEHLFLKCVFTNQCLSYVCNIFKIQFPLGEHGLRKNWSDILDKKQFFVLGTFRKAVWDLRNISKYKDLKIDINAFKLNFKYTMKSHLENLYNVYVSRKEVDTFKKVYIDDICTLRGNKIEVRLTF